MEVKVILIFSVILMAQGFGQNLDNPYEAGPYEVKRTSVISILNPGLDHNIEIWAPNVEGMFPVVYFMSGVGGKENGNRETIDHRLGQSV